MPQDKLPEPGEFTRLFKRQHAGIHAGMDAEKRASDAAGSFQAAEPVVAPPAAHPDLAPPPPRVMVNAVAPPGPVSNEPGEFTRFFMGGLPAKSTPSGSGTAARTPTGVQRPNTTVAPPRSSGGDSSGVFSGRFGQRPEAPEQKTEEYGVHNPRMGAAPDLSKQTPDERNPFDFKSPDFKAASKNDKEGEYTALFGRGAVPPAPRQSAVAPAPLTPMLGDAAGSAGTLRNVQAVGAAAPGPSEFTVVSNGRPAIPPGGSAPAPAANNAPDAARLPVNVNMMPMNPMAAMGGGMHLPGVSAAASMSGAHVNTPMGSANFQAPAMPPLNVAGGGGAVSRWSDQTKLVLFFGILAILAVILVVVLFAMQKN